MAIRKPAIIPFLLVEAPACASAWNEHLEWWEEEDAGAFNDISVFARCAVECQRDGQLECVKRLLAAVERLLTEGDEEVRAIVSTGFIEDLQNLASHEAFGADVFAPWLGTASRAAWNHVIQQWQGKDSLANVVRTEQRASHLSDDPKE